MKKDLQDRFRELARGERVYVGGKLATQNDLSALFFVRAVALYLKTGGHIGFVMPLAALTRGQFEAFRKGSFLSSKVTFEKPWTFDDSVQPLFPVPSRAVFARRERAIARAMPDRVTAYSGELPFRNAPEETADRYLSVVEDAPALEIARYVGGSPYRSAFHQGATLVPRMLCFVERARVGRLGGNPATPLVRSWRSRQEKQPWKGLDGLEGNVETEFLRPVYLGESIAPFRVLHAFEGVIPIDKAGDVIDARAATARGLVHLADWMQKAEKEWDSNKTSDLRFIEQLDYYGKLTAQFPIAAAPRVIYAASGSIPAAVVVNDEKAVVEHAVYWAASSSMDEARYLTAILNSETVRQRVAALQARGQWGAWHFDKVMFNLPIPRFDAKAFLRQELACAALQSEKVAAAVVLRKRSSSNARANSFVRPSLMLVFPKR